MEEEPWVTANGRKRYFPWLGALGVGWVCTGGVGVAFANVVATLTTVGAALAAGAQFRWMEGGLGKIEEGVRAALSKV